MGPSKAMVAIFFNQRHSNGIQWQGDDQGHFIFVKGGGPSPVANELTRRGTALIQSVSENRSLDRTSIPHVPLKMYLKMT